MDNSLLAGHYLVFLRDGRQLAPGSLRNSRAEVERFLAFLDGAAAPVPLLSVDAARVEQYLTPRCRDLHPWSARRAVSVLKDFFAFLTQHGYLPADPVALLPLPKPPKGVPLPKAVPIETVDALLAAARSHPDPFLAARDFAMIAALYALALRASELAGLRLADVHLEEASVTVACPKNARERRVPLPEPVCAAFRLYLSRREALFCRLPQASSQDAFFVGHHGAPVDRFVLWSRLRDASRRAGLRSAVSPHQLRHSCATHMVTLTQWPLDLVARWLGHLGRESTRHYTHLALADFVAALQRHPRWEGGRSL